jgi:RHS repeat-associated protein
MLSDGSNTFTWSARNQVATLNSVSLQYDGFGRRTKNLQNTSFLFDGANTVQELSGATPTANLISGGIDEIFTRADATGTFTPLQDTLGSTIALVDANGNLVTQYAYDPFGNTTVAGTANPNEFQYTGRENEGNGLYYYRSRYYSPVLHRFVSEDPLKLDGGDPNFYAFVGDDPINFIDPSGLHTEVILWNAVGYGESSQGHVSTLINQTSFSWGPGPGGALLNKCCRPGQMKVDDPASKFIDRNTAFRSGLGYVLDLTPDQEAALDKFLRNYKGNYNLAGRNCGTPVVE